MGAGGGVTVGATTRRESWRLGPLGFREHVEPTLRRLVADRLGVATDQLRDHVSFAEDLVAAASDVTELVVAAERLVGARVDEAAIERLRTYGDFVDAIVAARNAPEEAPPPLVSLRIVLVPARRDRRGIVVRSVWSSPYELDTVADDARRAGPGACLVVTLPADAPAPAVARVERRFAPLVPRGVTVRVHCEQPLRTRAVA